jgi:mannose-6-phosphate isomerase-like protein (cupin superfamily)
MSTQYDYRMNVNVKFEQSRVFDVQEEIDAVEDAWWHQTLVQINDAIVRLGVVEGEFHWHHHNAEDEFFFVLDGGLLIDVEGRDTVVLGPRQGYAVPHGVEHRTRAPRRTVMLMTSPATIVPTGD